MHLALATALSKQQQQALVFEIETALISLDSDLGVMIFLFAARQIRQASQGGVCAAFASASAVATSTGGTAISQAQAAAKAVCDCLKTGQGVAEAVAQAASSGNAQAAAQAIAEAAGGKLS